MTSPSDCGAPQPKVPRRALGFWDLALFYVVTGISLRWIATAAVAGPSSITIWIIAWGAFFVPLACAVLELSSRYPDEGGLYVWSKRAFGDFSGFIAGWSYWTSNLPYFPALLYFGASNALFMGGARWQSLAGSRTYFIIFALAGLALPTILNVYGLNLGKWLNNLGAIGTWIPILVVIALGVAAWSRFGSATAFTFRALVPSTRLKDIVFWSTLAFAFGGCESASFMGDEIKHPRRNIPRALLLGGTLMTVAYIAGTLSILVALPSQRVSELQGLIQAVAVTGARTRLSGAVSFVAALIAFSSVAAAGAYLAATARLPFVAGIDRYLPPAFGRLHPKWGTPHVALWTQSLCAVVIAFLGQAGTSVRGAYDVLVSMAVITYFIPYLFLFAALIKLQAEPAAPGVIRIPGGKPVAVALATVGFATTTLAILLAFLPAPEEANKPLAVAKVVLLTALLLSVGVVIYRLGKVRR